MNTYARALILGLVAFFGVAGPGALAGQQRDRTPIFLALPETFPDVDARAVLMREPGRDIVVLKADDFEPETLHVALRILARSRREDGPRVDRGLLVPIVGYAQRGPLTPERREQLESALAELQERPLSNVGNLGWGRWMRYRER